MAVYRKNATAYGVGNPLVDVFNAPIISRRVPTTRDRAEIGTVWCYKDVAGTDNVYILSSVVANVSTWTSCGGGNGNFDRVTVTTGNLTVTAGNEIITAGNLSVVAGTITVGAFAAAGIVINDAAGFLATSAGADGTVLIGTTGGAPAWATLTAGGGIGIVEAAGTITISNPGATGTTSGTDVAGPAVPTAGGLTHFLGYDANITTNGATANTVRIRLADSITSVAAITATNDFNMLAGTCTITSNDNGANAIYLHADAGVNETIHLRTSQGTLPGSIYLQSDVGGVAIVGGRAAANAIVIDSNNAAGGIDVDCGTGGVNVTAANGPIALISGTGAITIGTDGAAKDVSMGNASGASSLLLTTGTGAFNTVAGGVYNVDAVGALSLNSTTGIINIGNDADANNINIGTGASVRVIGIGNTTGASAIDIDCGTAGATFATSATAHPTTIGSTNTTSAFTAQSGTGAMTFTAGGIWDLNGVGAVTMDSTAGAITIGGGADAQAIGIGTGAAQRIVTLGNATGNTSVVLNAGTVGVAVGSNAIAHPVVVGSVTGAANTTIQSGTGIMLVTAGGTLDVNATDLVTIDSTAGAISIGAGADAFAMNFGTGAAARAIVIGNVTGATSVNVNVGTGASSFAADATVHDLELGSPTGASGTLISAGTGGLSLVAGGLVDVVPAVDTQAGAACTVNTNVGVATFTGLTTAAAASQALTVTNALATVGSAILCSLTTLGANDGQATVTRVKPAAGSFVVTYQNLGAAAINGDIILTFWIVAA